MLAFKNQSAFRTLALLALGWLGCGGDDPDDEEDLVSPSSPDALSGVLVIPGAARVQGQPPPATPSSSADVPRISGGSALSVSNGGQAVLQVDYESPTGYDDCYVQVRGASDYFRLEVGSAVQAGTLQIPVNIPDNVDTGSFSLYTCIAGDNGAVSNPLSTPVSVMRADSPGSRPSDSPGTLSSSCQQAIDSARQSTAGITGNTCVTGCINALYSCAARNDCQTLDGCTTTYTNCVTSCF